MRTCEMERIRTATEDMGMTLKKWFEGLDENAYVRVATKDGTRFVLAGTCKDVLDEMPNFDGTYKKKAFAAMESAKEKYLSAVSIDTGSIYNPKKRKTHEGHVKGLGTQFLKAIVAYEKFKPLSERRVVDDFVAGKCIDDVDAPVYVVYVEGNEAGAYEKINADGKGDVMGGTK